MCTNDQLNSKTNHLFNNQIKDEDLANSEIVPLIKKLGWMTMNQRYFYFTSTLVYKCMNGLTSKTLSDRFNKPLDVHNIETRFAKNNNLCLPHPRTNYMKKGFSYTGVNLEQITTGSEKMQKFVFF